MPTSKRGRGARKGALTSEATLALRLPTPKAAKEKITERRKQLTAYQKYRGRLMQLFRRCASGEIKSEEFYDDLPKYWAGYLNNRLQGSGWERRGKDSDFQSLSQSFIKIVESSEEDRDDTVIEEIDKLKKKNAPARKAFLSEMLCLRFPDRYPVLNKPVQAYLKSVKFKAPQGSTEGARYIDLAKKLRISLIRTKGYPAKSLAELDAVIWLKFGPKPVGRISEA